MAADLWRNAPLSTELSFFTGWIFGDLDFFGDPPLFFDPNVEVDFWTDLSPDPLQ